MLYELLVGGAILVLAAQLVRGRSPSDLLGAYSIVGRPVVRRGRRSAASSSTTWPSSTCISVSSRFAAFVLLARDRTGVRRTHSRRFLAAGTALTIYCSRRRRVRVARSPNRIQERNTFVVAPFFLIALLVWVDRGLPRRAGWRPPWPSRAALLPLAIPFERFIETGAISDTLDAAADLECLRLVLMFDSIDATVLAGGILAAALFMFVPRRWALALPAVALVFFVAVSHNVWFGERGFRAGVGRALSSRESASAQRDWIDRAVPKDATVAVRVDEASRTGFTVNQNEFFNRSVGPVYFIGGPTPWRPRGDGGDDRRGDRRDPDESWRRIDPQYLLADGRRLARRRRAGARSRYSA